MTSFYEHLADATRIAIAGDWHMNILAIDKILNKVERMNAQVVLHTGDFGYFPSKEDYSTYVTHITERAIKGGYYVVFIEGNHEQYTGTEGYWWSSETILTREGLSTLRNKADEHGFVAITPRIIWATRGAAARIGTNKGRGVSFIGLGGAGSIYREHAQMYGFWSPNEHVTNEDVARVADGVKRLGGSVDIMLTHDAPAGARVPTVHAIKPDDAEARKLNRRAVEEAEVTRERIAEAVEIAHPTVLFHGHWHRFDRCAQTTIGDVTVPMIISLSDETGVNNLYFTDTSLWEGTEREIEKNLHRGSLWL